jgi:hypothetical protein
MSELHYRCHHGIACPEVTARVAAAHRTKYAEGCEHHADELFAIAQRIAEAHRQENELPHRSDEPT